ncbi:MAG: 50S ribosomal protein L1 [Candidatus Brocadiales bacterium]
MGHKGKRYQDSQKLIDKSRKYDINEAIHLLKGLKGAKFDETVEIVMKLGIDPKRSDQLVRGSVSLPKGIGKERKVIVFATGEKAELAEKAGASEVGAEDLAKKIEGGWTDFDVAIASTDMMRVVGKLGRILGPQGKMPSPKSGTVTDNIETVVKEFMAGKIEYRTDAGANIHASVGKVSFSEDDLATNIRAFILHITSSRPPTAKGAFVQRVFISSTMSPGIRLTV